MPKVSNIERMVLDEAIWAKQRYKEKPAGRDTYHADVPTVPITIAEEVEYEEIDACCPPARVLGIPSPIISPISSSSESIIDDGHHPLFLSADSSSVNGSSAREAHFSIGPSGSSTTSLMSDDPLPTKPPALPLVNGKA